MEGSAGSEDRLEEQDHALGNAVPHESDGSTGSLVQYRALVAALLAEGPEPPMGVRRACALLRPVILTSTGSAPTSDLFAVLPGTVEELAAVLGSESSTLAAWAMDALASIAGVEGEHAMPAIEAAGVAPLLARMLGSKDGNLASAASDACSLISLLSKSFALQLIDAGAIPTLVHLLQSNDESRAANAGTALRGLLEHEQAIMPTLEAGGLPALMAMLRSESVLLRSSSLSCLSCIPAGPDEAKRAINDSDVLPALAGMPGDAVQEEGKHGVLVLDTIKKSPSAHVMGVLAKGTTAPALLEMVRGPATDENAMAVQQMSMSILLIYSAASTRMRDAVVGTGAVPELVHLLSSTDALLQQRSCLAIRNLCVKPDSAAHRQAVMDAGALPALVKLMSPCDTGVSENALIAIQGLSANPPCRVGPVLDCGALPGII